MPLFDFLKPKSQRAAAAVQTFTLGMHVWLDNAQKLTILVRVPYVPRPGDELLNLALEAADQHPFIKGRLLKGDPAKYFKNTPLRGAIILPGGTLSSFYKLER